MKFCESQQAMVTSKKYTYTHESKVSRQKQSEPIRYYYIWIPNWWTRFWSTAWKFSNRFVRSLSLFPSFPLSLSLIPSLCIFAKFYYLRLKRFRTKHFSFTSKLPDATKNNQQQWNYQTKLNTKHTEKDRKIKKKATHTTDIVHVKMNECEKLVEASIYCDMMHK